MTCKKIEMKLIMENWRKFLKEGFPNQAFVYMPQNIYYWQTDRPESVVIGEHVPKARPLQGGVHGRMEEIFEEVRLAVNPSAPSRLNCVYLCENLEGLQGGSYCSYPTNKAGEETYEIELKGSYEIFKTNSEYWTEAYFRSNHGTDEEEIKRWAEAYWEGSEGGPYQTIEILVTPPQAAIIIRKYEP